MGLWRLPCALLESTLSKIGITMLSWATSVPSAFFAVYTTKSPTPLRPHTATLCAQSHVKSNCQGGVVPMSSPTLRKMNNYYALLTVEEIR